MGNDSGNKNSSQETVTISPEVTKKIEDLQEKLAAKEQEIQTVKEKTIDVIKKIKAESEIQTNLPARIIKQHTFKGNFHNGYADGTVEKARKKLRKTQRKASAAK